MSARYEVSERRFLSIIKRCEESGDFELAAVVRALEEEVARRLRQSDGSSAGETELARLRTPDYHGLYPLE